MPSYQINIQPDEIFIEYELSHNSLKLQHLTLVNVGDLLDVHIKPRRDCRYSAEATFGVSSVIHLCITKIWQCLRQQGAKCANY